MQSGADEPGICWPGALALGFCAPGCVFYAQAVGKLAPTFPAMVPATNVLLFFFAPAACLALSGLVVSLRSPRRMSFEWTAWLAMAVTFSVASDFFALRL
jgi:4-amino-4-deoxy-L-arabinose transferase-like glycosyltransferase